MRKLFIFILLLLPDVVFCQTASDTSGIINSYKIIIKQFDQERVNELKNDGDFDYQDETPEKDVEIGFFTRMILAMINGMIRLFGNKIIGYIISILILVISILILIILFAALVYGFYNFVIMGKTNLFVVQANSKLAYNVHSEDIHSIDFKKEIEEAVLKKEFKKAVRLLYLLSLKILSDKDHINWSPNKTNHDYVYELKNPSIKDLFGRLSYYFNHVWYGDFGVDQELYEVISNSFDQLQQRLNQKGEY